LRAAARSQLVNTCAFGLRRPACMFWTTRSNWPSVRWRSIHDSALVQYWRACACVSRAPATAFAVRVHDVMNARRTAGG